MNPTDPLTRPGAAVVDRSDRVRLEVAGPDRVRFLHNLTTQDVKHLKSGEGGEAFVTSPQGKTLGYASLLATDSHLLLRTDREGWGPVLPHLTRYGVFDDVTLDDASNRTFEWHVAGPGADRLLNAAGAASLPEGELRHVEARLGGVDVRLVRETLTAGGGLTIIGPREGASAAEAALVEAAGDEGLLRLSPEDFDWLRIEQGTPVAGRDVTPDNLPQEVARDTRTINFVKGCYLGQETVARIDALGHVNKLLCGLLVDSAEAPPAGAVLEAEGKPIGTITSAAFSPPRGRVVALGFVRRGHTAPGTALRTAGDPRADVTVTGLPMPPA